jgi:GTP-binding protein HflX
MFDVRDKPQHVENAFLIGAYFDRRRKEEAQALLDELGELVRTLGITIVGCQLVFAREPTARYLIGSGKTKELTDQAKALGADCIVWDNELSPAQQRAWESEGDICVIDRHEVILDIFNMRARTREARLQVELARLEYSIPRLTRMWAHLDRQGGGAGGGKGGAGAARGEGETLAGLAQLMGCNAKSFGTTLKSQYNKVFVETNMQPALIQSNIESLKPMACGA